MDHEETAVEPQDQGEHRAAGPHGPERTARVQARSFTAVTMETWLEKLMWMKRNADLCGQHFNYPRITEYQCHP